MATASDSCRSCRNCAQSALLLATTIGRARSRGRDSEVWSVRVQLRRSDIALGSRRIRRMVYRAILLQEATRPPLFDIGTGPLLDGLSRVGRSQAFEH